MDVTIKSYLVILLLLVVLAAIGVLVGREGGLTGAAIKRPITCYDDDDCNDRIPNTLDICRNPGTDYALCVNRVQKK